MVINNSFFNFFPIFFSFMKNFFSIFNPYIT